MHLIKTYRKVLYLVRKWAYSWMNNGNELSLSSAGLDWYVVTRYFGTSDHCVKWCAWNVQSILYSVYGQNIYWLSNSCDSFFYEVVEQMNEFISYCYCGRGYKLCNNLIYIYFNLQRSIFNDLNICVIITKNCQRSPSFHLL